MTLEVFGSRVLDLRKEKGLSQREMAEILGITHVAVGYYENGKREPTLSIMKAYALYFDVTLDYLVGLSDSRR